MLSTYQNVRQSAPKARVVNHGIVARLPELALWCLACASCFALGWSLCGAIARHMGAGL